MDFLEWNCIHFHDEQFLYKKLACRANNFDHKNIFEILINATIRKRVNIIPRVYFYVEFEFNLQTKIVYNFRLKMTEGVRERVWVCETLYPIASRLDFTFRMVMQIISKLFFPFLTGKIFRGRKQISRGILPNHISIHQFIKVLFEKTFLSFGDGEWEWEKKLKYTRVYIYTLSRSLILAKST